MKRIISLTLAILMLCASVLCVSCGAEEEKMLYTEDTVLGQGDKTVAFTVEHIDGTKINFTIGTDKEILADALLEHELIDGPVEAYGIYVKKVNGITHDYNRDGTYWMLLIDGEASMHGADSVAIEEGVSYTFKAAR